MKTIHLISATVLLAAAGGAFAASDDGNSDSAWLQHPASAQLQAAAPGAAAAPAPTSPLIDTNTQIVTP